mgnify:CR=1 FL=1
MNLRGKVTTQELARDLALRLQVSPGQAHNILKHVCQAVREQLQTGCAVEFGDLFTLSVHGEAEIRADESGGFSAYAPTTRSIVTEPLGALREDLEKAKQSAIYYISLDDGHFKGLLADHFGRRGWKLVHTRNAMEAQNRMANNPPVAVIFESTAEGWQDLVRELKCTPATNWIPIVGIFPESARSDPVSELAILPDEVIYEPFDFTEFIQTAGSELAARVTEPQQGVTELEVVLSGSQRDRRTAREVAEEILFRRHLPEEFTRDAGAALSEALDNAVRHGHQMVECCTIVVRLILDPKRLTIAVRDSGPGFDYAAVLNAVKGRAKRGAELTPALAKAAAALKTRTGDVDNSGIAHMLELVDHVDFNAQGNEVLLCKNRPRRRRKKKSGQPTGDTSSSF